MPVIKQIFDDGVLNCVITKDLSRLGRDHIMTDYLTEIYFPAMGILRYSPAISMLVRTLLCGLKSNIKFCCSIIFYLA